MWFCKALHDFCKFQELFRVKKSAETKIYIKFVFKIAVITKQVDFKGILPNET